MLGLKQHSSEADWIEAWDSATKLHPFTEIIKLKDEAEGIIEMCYGDDTIIAYSGGKDSLVLRHLAEDCLNKPRFINCILQNEFPRYVEWLEDTCPENTAFVIDEKISLEFLNDNEDYLFPVDVKQQNFYVQTWRQPCHSYMKEHDMCKIMTGKRGSDGNNCGKKNKFGCKETVIRKPLIISLNPIADWSHTQLLAYIQYFNIELPEIYYYPNGFRFGTHPWTERRRLNGKYCDTFEEIMTLDESVIINAADKLNLAKKFLDGKLDY